MTLYQRLILSGAGLGLVGAGVAVGAVVGLGTVVGGGLGLLAGLLAGGWIAWMSMSRMLRPAIACLTALSENQLPSRGEEESLPRTGNIEFDTEIAQLYEFLTRSRRLQSEFAKAERTAQMFWASMNATSGAGKTELARLDSGVKLSSVLDRLRQTAVEIHRDASLLQEVNERVASGAGDQSEAVARTASAVEALSEKIDRISLNAEEAAKACERARDEARKGLQQVHSVIEGMDQLLAQIEANGRKARRLEDRSNEIEIIVDLIRGISSRTDMLALNATIESVRAGEHGRGFAVVAEEIRKLSERSAAATREIGSIVEAIQADTHESIRALSQEQLDMKRESERVRETGVALERISQVAEHSARLVEGISRSTNDQVLATQDLVRAMQRISEVTHQTMDRTNQSRKSLNALVQSCEPWQRLGATPSAPEVGTTREQLMISSTNGSSRRKPELVQSENAR